MRIGDYIFFSEGELNVLFLPFRYASEVNIFYKLSISRWVLKDEHFELLTFIILVPTLNVQ